MIKGTLSFRPAFLALAMLFASVSAPVSAVDYKKVTGIVIGLALYVRLRTKPTAKYENTPKKDMQEIFMALKSLDPAVISKLVELFDKWIIGQKFSLVDTELDTIQEDGSVLKVHDRKVKTVPFGLVGFIDAYGIQSLELFAKLAESISKIEGGLKVLIPGDKESVLINLFK